MNTFIRVFRLAAIAWLLTLPASFADTLRVCATVPDLGDLAQQVGGDEVTVTVFAKGVEDPHFVDAKPSFVKAVSQADLFIQMGMELEVGWAPLLLQGGRNANVLPGKPGFVDASTVIAPLEVPAAVDRSMGDVHAGGNPHFLTDPENGRRVAALIRDRLAEIRPEKKDYFTARFDRFSAELAAKESEWNEMLSPRRGAKFVADHDMWVYFAKRFGLETAGFLEPKPGLSPTTKHLEEIIDVIKAQQVPMIFASSYYDPRHARFVAEHSGAIVVPLAHQVGSRQGSDTYIEMCDYNVRHVADATRSP